MRETHRWERRLRNLARIRLQLPAADADASRKRGRAPSGRFDVQSSTLASPSSPRAHAGRHLDANSCEGQAPRAPRLKALATKVGDGSALVTGDSGGPESSGRWLSANSDLNRLDAELLVAHVLDLNRPEVLAFPEKSLTERQTGRLNRLADRRRGQEPLAYILGRKEFFGLNFRVGPDVLVPRPETELTVELALRLAPRNARIADLGTGCGCIAVALKVHRPDLRVVALDVSFAALHTAAANAAANGAAIDFVQGNWLGCLGGPFDGIVANPPYVAEGDPALAALRSEPRHALVAGADGMRAIRRIVEQAPGRMTAAGHLILEHGCGQAGEVRDSLALAGFREIETHRDLAGLERATVAFMEG